jgi:hypothetical protein
LVGAPWQSGLKQSSTHAQLLPTNPCAWAPGPSHVWRSHDHVKSRRNSIGVWPVILRKATLKELVWE